MTAQKVLTHTRYADECTKKIEEWKISDKDKNAVRKFLNDYKSGDVTGKIGSNIDTTIERQTQFLRPCLEFLGKGKKIIIEFDSKDIEAIKKLKTAILNDKILSTKKKPYSLRVKRDMLSSTASFIKHSLPLDKSPALYSSLKIKIKLKKEDPKFLTEEEVEKLYNACKNNEERYFIAMLFSSGTRAEEFHNIRLSDVELPTGSNMFVKLRIRDQYSKTKGRTISLYWKHTLEAVRDYINDRKKEGIEPEDVLFNRGYDSMRLWLPNLGKRVLKKNVHYHLARHTCASRLSHKFNRQQLCIYFGWLFSSHMPDVYISREGVEMEELDNKIEKVEIEKIKDKLEKDNENKSMEIEELNKQVEDLKDEMSNMQEVWNLTMDKKFAEMKKDFETNNSKWKKLKN